MKIETKRLILRQYKKSDFDDYYEFASNPEVMLASGSKPVKSYTDRQSFERAMLDEDCFAIVLKAENKVIGQIKYQDDIHRYKVNSVSIGYELSKPYWGNGYMPEALRAMVKNAFENKGVEVIGISHFTINDKSRRVIEKCGFKHEASIPKAYKRFDGTVFDDETYHILKEEYEELKLSWD